MNIEPSHECPDGEVPTGYLVAFGDLVQIGFPDGEGRFVPAASAHELPLQRVCGLAPGLGLVLPCRAEALTESGEPLVEFEIEVERRRPICRTIRAAPGYELTGTLLRRVRLAELVRRAVSANTARFLRWEGTLLAARAPSGESGFGAPAVELETLLASVIDTPARRRVSDEFLAEVASIYREAVAFGLPPAKEVERRLGPISPASARRWIMLARKRKLLGPAIGPFRPGELR
jgi:hypothetical protein